MEDVVSFDLAKLAHEKGFNEPCREAYNSHHHELNSAIFYNGNEFFESEDMQNALDNSNHAHYLAPTYSQLQTWLRNKHNIIAIALPHFNQDYQIHEQDIIWDSLWSYVIWDAFSFYQDDIDFSSYEIALEAALLNALKIVKDEKLL